MPQFSNIEYQPSPALPQMESALNVAGTYQIFEFHKVRGQRKLVPLPLTVTVTQSPDHIKLELYDETTNSKEIRNYPVRNVPCWSAERKALIYCRPVKNGFMADLIFAPGLDLSLRTTYRVTWQLDAQGRIHEIIEDFDATGRKLETSTGHNRVLIPVSQA